MVAERGDASKGDHAADGWLFSWRTVERRLLSWAIGIVAIAMAGFIAAPFLAPRLAETLQPGSIQPDGDLAFTQGLSLKAPWPYAVPSHPDDRLSSGDTTLMEDGAPIGTLDPSHADIRRMGGGRYDFWQGSLWFSTTGFDPRDPAHSYTFSVRTRLASNVVQARFWCAMVLLTLVALAAARASVPYVANGWDRHGGPTRRAGSLMGLTISRLILWLWRRRWRFRAPFLVVTIGVLAVFTILATLQPVPIMYQPDSYEYIKPGLRLADGLSIAGMSIRDLGYPLLTFVAIEFGSIADIVPLQFAAVMLAMACTLLLMANCFRAMLREDGYARGDVPVLLTAGLSAVGVFYSLLLFSHDEFVIDLYSFMAEAAHFLPLALALLCFASGWATEARRRRIVLLALAADFAFVSTVVKPSSMMAFALCAVSVLVACFLHRRSLRSMAVVAALLLSVGFIGSVRQLDVWATPPEDDFGAKVLFCNHLDVIDGHLEATTPERAKIKALIAHVFSLGPFGWPLQGYNGDQCTFEQEFTDAIKAAAKAEGRTPKDWQIHETVTAVLTHPLRYARHASRQLLHFVLYPLDDADQRPQSSLTDSDWTLLQTYGAMRQIPRDRLEAVVPNWFGDVAPDLVSELKGGLRTMARTFAIVAAASTILALVTAFRRGQWQHARSDVILLAVGAFTSALPLTVAMSHTFDVGRYSVDILPFTVLWWCLGIVYLARAGILCMATLLSRRSRKPAPPIVMPVSGPTSCR